MRNYIVQTVASSKIKEEKVPLFSIHSHAQSNRAGDQASSVELLDGLRFILNRCKENTDSGHKHCELSYFFLYINLTFRMLVNTPFQTLQEFDMTN